MSFDVKNLVQNVQSVFQTTVSELEKAFDAGERLQVKVLNAKVAAELNQNPKDTSVFVSHLVHNCEPFAHVSPGIKGGVLPGARKAKVAKVVKNPRKAKAPKVSDTSTDSE